MCQFCSDTSYDSWVEGDYWNYCEPVEVVEGVAFNGDLIPTDFYLNETDLNEEVDYWGWVSGYDDLWCHQVQERLDQKLRHRRINILALRDKKVIVMPDNPVFGAFKEALPDNKKKRARQPRPNRYKRPWKHGHFQRFAAEAKAC